MAQQSKRLVEIGMDESSAFTSLLESDNWIPTRSEGDKTGGWYRMTHKRKNVDITVAYGSDRKIKNIFIG